MPSQHPSPELPEGTGPNRCRGWRVNRWHNCGGGEVRRIGEIGERSIVGAGSVVTRDVPPWSVVAGNPARVLKKIRKGGCGGDSSDFSSNRRR